MALQNTTKLIAAQAICVLAAPVFAHESAVLGMLHGHGADGMAALLVGVVVAGCGLWLARSKGK